MKNLFTICVLLASVLLQAQTQMGNDIDGLASGDHAGQSTSISSSGQTVIVGSFRADDNGPDSGHVRVFNWSGNDWNQYGSTLLGEYQGDWAGISVDISGPGTVVCFGARQNDLNGTSAGSAYVYIHDGTDWVQRGGALLGSNAGDLFGFSIAMSTNGSIIAVGSPQNDDNGNDAGKVEIFQFNGTNWQLMGVPLFGETLGDLFGYAVDINFAGNVLAVGAPANDGNGTDAGHVRVFQWDGTNWVQKGLDIDSEAADDRFGNAVSLSADGNILAVGAIRNDGNGTDAGHVRVFEWDTNTSGWFLKGNDIDGDSENDLFGRSVSLNEDGTLLVVGAPLYDNSGTEMGQAKIFHFDGTDWVQLGNDLYGEAPSDEFGVSAAISSTGNRIVVGASKNDDSGTDAGQARVYDITGLLGVEGISSNPTVKLFPNPTQGKITIATQENFQVATVKIYTILGQEISKMKFEDNETLQFEIKGAKGLYFVNVEIDGNNLQTYKVIKQ